MTAKAVGTGIEFEKIERMQDRLAIVASAVEQREIGNAFVAADHSMLTTNCAVSAFGTYKQFDKRALV